MIPLNLPPFEYQLKKAEGKLWIFDVIRKKYVVLIPEEWVRQHFVHFLLNDLKYPRALIKVEGGLRFNQMAKRSDIVVYDRQGNPWMVIECKSPDIVMNENTIFQASVYNQTLRAKFVVITNGVQHHYAQVDWNLRTATPIPEMPRYNG
jgi:hypothetical protein